MLDFDSFDYFGDLLALSLLAVPIFFGLRRSPFRNLFLGTAGLYLLTLIAPRLAVFYLAFWAGVFVMQYVIRRWPSEQTRWIALTTGVVLALAPMVIWKITPTYFVIEFNLFFNNAIDTASPWFGAIDRARNIILPIGLSFATFRAIDLLVKVHLDLVDPLSFTRMYAFGFFPPVQVIGPVIEVTEVEAQLREPMPPDPRSMLSGLMLIATGLVKVFVIAYVLEASSSVFNPTAAGAVWEYWFELFRFALYFYFNFSGFSDIAIGSALLYGFHLRPNFNNPYMKTNPQDFWNSWHMSLTRFCQRNVFVPLGGMRAGRQYGAMLATIMVIALWHDLTLPLVLFGIYHGVGLIGHRIVASRRPVNELRLLRVAKIGTLFVFVSLSLPLLLLPIGDLSGFYGRLIGA
jgi:alginate O-acetyltransferase complex protein AlgI